MNHWFHDGVYFRIDHTLRGIRSLRLFPIINHRVELFRRSRCRSLDFCRSSPRYNWTLMCSELYDTNAETGRPQGSSFIPVNPCLYFNLPRFLSGRDRLQILLTISFFCFLYTLYEFPDRPYSRSNDRCGLA